MQHRNTDDVVADAPRTTTVTLWGPTDPRAQDLRARVPNDDRRFLFEGDDSSPDGDLWSVVERVAIAAVDGNDVGLATLGFDNGVAVIIGLWVDPAARGHGVSTKLLVALADESRRRYGQPPWIDLVSPEGMRAVEAACRAGAQLVIHNW